MEDARVERVLLAVSLVPRGRVASYGLIGRVAGVGPRQVGAVLRRGDGVPWWRVTDREGRLPAALAAEALRHWRAEGMALRPDGHGVRLEECAVDQARLLADFVAAAR